MLNNVSANSFIYPSTAKKLLSKFSYAKCKIEEIIYSSYIVLILFKEDEQGRFTEVAPHLNILLFINSAIYFFVTLNMISEAIAQCNQLFLYHFRKPKTKPKNTCTLC